MEPQGEARGRSKCSAPDARQETRTKRNGGPEEIRKDEKMNRGEKEKMERRKKFGEVGKQGSGRGFDIATPPKPDHPLRHKEQKKKRNEAKKRN